ncbi:DUF7482 domain-containing protein [Hymenobacter terricola]|uniref:DUF7482 domain-containing protein n=1 Tax=Hymenobacter terricola TaxID=2819236 RepID=UPI001B316492|nr:hypothetical protein [Hymenobacter terricola]
MKRSLFAPSLFVALGLLASSTLVGCKDSNDDAAAPDQFARPTEHLTGIPPLSGLLARSKFTLSSVVQVDLDRNVARLPLFRGTYNGTTVWFVRTDVSDAGLATQLGLNFAPRLANADQGCPACVQTLQSPDPVPGRAAVEFAGTVDFTPMRIYTPSPTGFPPLAAQPGSVAGAGYSDLVRVQGSTVVYNAPIIAVGNGPFDVSPAHTNTHDRVIAIDTQAMTVDLQFIRAFAFGKDVFYFSFGSTGALSATLERGTFVPAIATIPFANQDVIGARSDIFTFINGKLGANDPKAQGLMHVTLDNPPGQLSLQNPALLESLRKLGDSHNILGSFPTLTDKTQRELYSPLWDLNLAMWSDEVVAKGENFVQTDGNTVQQLAARGLVLSPGGGKLGSANFIVNCPALGFADTAPTEPQSPPVAP